MKQASHQAPLPWYLSVLTSQVQMTLLSLQDPAIYSECPIYMTRRSGQQAHPSNGSSVHSASRKAQLRRQAALGRKYLQELRREVVRLAMLADEEVDGEVFAGMAERLEEPELKELKKAYEVRAAKKFPAMPQLRARSEAARGDESVFLV